MKRIKVYKLFSDNCDGQLVTPDAYKEITLQMSTGDWHTHTKKVVTVSSLKGVLTLEEMKLDEEIYLENEAYQKLYEAEAYFKSRGTK